MKKNHFPWYLFWSAAVVFVGILAAIPAPEAHGQKKKDSDLTFPPKLPGGKLVVTDRSPEFLKPPENAKLRDGVEIAKEVPEVDFLYYPGQNYPGKPWSVWGDGCAAADKYYSAIGDHHAPRGNALVYEYDASKKELRILVSILDFLESVLDMVQNMLYRPGKVHSMITLGEDGWLYYATHRGSPKHTTDATGYKGDWIFRTHPKTGKTEIVASHPVPKHCIPASTMDPKRMIFYGGTAPGKDAPSQDVMFLAYDVKNRKTLKVEKGGFNRYAILAQSTGKVYWLGKKYDPKTNTITDCEVVPHVRAATQETPQGIVYGVSEKSADIWAFDVRSEKLTPLGPGAVGKQEYTTTIDADPTGRYLYYIPGAHGGAQNDGSPVIQFDVKTKKRKVIAFLHPFYNKKYGYTPLGTFGSALSPQGDKLYITWNGNRSGADQRGRYPFDTCALTVIHIPKSERP